MSIQPNKTNTLAPIAVTLSLLCTGTQALAQAVPDAGSILRDIESLQGDVAPTLKPDEPLPAPLPDTGEKIELKSVSFDGYQGMATEAELQALVADSIGRQLGFNGLQYLADRITNYLKNKGYFLAFAYLPEQDISQGNLRILIRPGRIEGGKLQNRQNIDDDRLRRSSDRVFNTLNQSLETSENDIIRARQLERGLLLANDLPGIKASANLEKGAEPGTTRVNVELDSTPRYTGAAWVDNYGNRYTGSWRANALGQINNLSGRGDQLSLLANLSTETLTDDLELKYARLGYSLPLGYRGLTASFGVSHLEYTLGKELEMLDYNGSATTVSAQLSYPITRSRQHSLYINGGFDYKTLEDKQAATQIKDREYKIATLGLSGDRLDQWQGGGLSNYSALLTTGDLDRTGNRDDFNADRATARTHGNFTKLNLSGTRLQKLTERTSLLVSLDTQLTPNNLDSAEEFTLGGPNGVRAYASGEGAGDYGWQATVEARYDLPNPIMFNSKLQLQAFVDTGHITLQADKWDGYQATSFNTNGKNSYQLTGIGIGASLAQGQRYRLKASYAWKLNDDIDDRSTTDKDTEGRDVNGQFWLQAMAWF